MERVRFIHILLVAGCVAVIAAVGVITLAYVEAGNYNATIEKATTKLTATFKQLEKSTERGILDDPDTPIATLQQDTASAKELITKSEHALDDLQQASERLELPLQLGLNDQTRRAPILKQEAEALITQTRGALLDYEKTLTYLSTYSTHWAATRAHIDTFNEQTDLNIYAGQGDTLRQIASDIRMYIQALRTQTTPRGFADVSSQSIAVMERAAAGFDALARGIDVAIDDLIYSAAADIESAGREIETINRTAYEDAIRNSRIIKEMSELTEKLDPLVVAEAARM